MVKVKIFIDNDGLFLDDEVSLDVELQYLPRIGDYLYLSESSYEKLIKKIRYSTERPEDYIDYYLQGKNEEFALMNPIVLQFANVVSYVEHNEGQDFVNIVLSQKNDE